MEIKRTDDVELAHGAANIGNKVIDAAGGTLTDQAMGMVLDLAEGKIKAEKMLNYDEMTGLYSSRKFQTDGVEMVGPNLHVLIADIGHLGYINEVSGHPSGDRYKKRVADIVGGKTEEMQAFKTASGIEFKGYMLTKGDEMGILMEGSRQKAELLEAKIKEEVEKLGKITPNSELNASISIGIASGDEFREELSNFFVQHQDLDIKLTAFKFFERVAGFRSELDKIHGRLKEMVKMRRNRKKFGRLYPYLAKNSIGVDRKRLRKMSKRHNETDFL